MVYYVHWLMGVGAVAHEGLMEDAATVEICRVQLWIWVKARVSISEKGKHLEMDRLM